jgi:hypothetical protein
MKNKITNLKDRIRLTLVTVLILSLLAAFVPLDEAYAANKTKTAKVTVYKGQTFYYGFQFRKLTKLKSSNKSILAIKRKNISRDDWGNAIKGVAISITAKKVGATVLTLKYATSIYKDGSHKNYFTEKIKVTVKDPPVGSIENPITLQSGSNVSIKSIDDKKQIDIGLTIYKDEEAKNIVYQVQPNNVDFTGRHHYIDDRYTYYYADDSHLPESYRGDHHEGPKRSFYVFKYDYNVVKGFNGGRYAYLQSPFGEIRNNDYKRISSLQFEVYYMRSDIKYVDNGDGTKYIDLNRNENFRFVDGDTGTYYVGLFIEDSIKEIYGINVLTSFNSQRQGLLGEPISDYRSGRQLDGCIKTILP